MPSAGTEKQVGRGWTLATSSLRSCFLFNLLISKSYFIIDVCPEQATLSLTRVATMIKMKEKDPGLIF